MIPAPAAESARSRPASRLARGADLAVLFAFLGVLLFRFFRPGDQYLSYFTDDFFYYFEVARNLVETGVSTFDGSRLTNGYHPLWLLVVAAHYAVFGDTLAFFVVFTIVIGLLCWGSYLVFRSSAAAVTGEGVASRLLALYAACFLLVLSRTGMEVSSAVFFGALLLRRLQQHPFAEQNGRQLALTGLCASLMVLSRIDTAIYIMLFVVLQGAAGPDRLPAFIRRLVPFGVGGLLVPVYVAINLLVFDTLTPVSGTAKHLKALLPLSLRPIDRFFQMDAINVLFVWPAMALLAAAAVLLLRQRAERPGRAQAIVILSFIGMPVVYYPLLCLLSDWPMWTWYFYPLVLPLVALLPHAIRPRLDRLSRPLIARPLLFAVPAAMAVALAGLLPLNPASYSIYQAAQRIAEFSAKNPGCLAMGDRGGMPAYLVPGPIVQLEGLVEDRAYFDNISRRRDLVEVLRELKVDYYVATNPVRDGNCLRAREPRMSGPQSPRMEGVFCAPPLAQFEYEGYRNYIWKVE